MAVTAERCSPRPRVPALLQPFPCHGKALWPELGVCLGLRQRRHTWPPALLLETCVLVPFPRSPPCVESPPKVMVRWDPGSVRLVFASKIRVAGCR